MEQIKLGARQIFNKNAQKHKIWTKSTQKYIKVQKYNYKYKHKYKYKNK